MAVVEAASVSGQGSDRALAVGSKVFVGDLVVTDAAGEAQLLFTDGTRMIVGSNSSLMIEEILFSGKAAGNRFAVQALSGAFRFISGDSGDQGYSIRTPSATISVRGTAFDFTVTPEGETKLLLLEGEATLCSESGEKGEGGDCATVATPCAVARTDIGEDVEEIEAGDRRVQETREHFPFVTSEPGLLEEFRVVGHGCAGGGGLSEFALDEQTIRKVGPAVLGAAAIIAGIFAATRGGDGDPSTIDTNNGSN
ncbi:MAG: FecR family protein [Alphaproteobacteria bacterium]